MDTEAQFRCICTFVFVFQSLMTSVALASTAKIKAIPAIAIKFGQPFIETFMKVVPVLSNYFKDNTNAVVGLVTALQRATRILPVRNRHVNEL